ncbi:MAG: 3-oxoacyl-ACP reductase FabG [Clostridiales bacterium]|nr:3-oxoacyl-ACP reductase FabG [Clostridiales bacterium]
MNRKTALVTGSSRGIGKAIAMKFAENGYDVIINCAHREAELQSVKREINDFCGTCTAFYGDIGDFTVCEELYTLIRQQYGRLDVLVNNAGVSYVGLLQDMSPEDWSRIIRTNLTSVYNCCKLAIPLMLQVHRGKIINISSVWGDAGASCEVAYSASKGGVNSLTRALARELAPSNIQVNAIACGAIDTEMNHWLSDEELRGLIDEIPAGRLGSPQEAADLAWQLASAGSYLTGQVITLDGGWA